MTRFKTIQYGFNREAIYARCGDKVALTGIDFDAMVPEDSFEIKYTIIECSVDSLRGDPITWTKKVPVALKNVFRKHFGMKLLKDDGKPVLLGGMTDAQYLCKEARQYAKNAGHDVGRFKDIGEDRQLFVAKCKKCGREVNVNPQPRSNECDVTGEVFGHGCY